MARPKKTTHVVEEKVIKVDNSKDISKLENENKELKSELSEMRAMIQALSKSIEDERKNRSEKQIISVKNNDEDEDIDIPLNKVVKVMSLYAGGLNLKTGENGKVFRFNNFGDIQPIIYGDLVQVINHQHRFCTEGYFMILDKNVVKAHALEDNYKKILDDKQIRNILEYDNEKITQLFTSTTKNIQETIITNITRKLKANDYVDKNKVDLLSKLYGVDLYAFAQDDFEILVNNKR